MSWICPKCETENSDELSHCEVCDEPSPAFILQTKRAQRAWYNATYQNTILGYEHYLLLYPNGRHTNEAKKRIDELKREEAAKEKAAWDNCCFVNMSSAYSKYIKDYPSGAYIFEAKKRYEECKDKEDWSRASSTNTLEPYQKYLKNHPKGNFAGNAKVIILRLEEEESKRQKEEEERKRKENEEMNLWKSAELNGTLSYYISYIIQYPKGKFSSEANSEVGARIGISAVLLAMILYGICIGVLGIEMPDTIAGTVLVIVSFPFFCLLAVVTYVVFIRIKTTIILSHINKVGKGSRIKNFFWFISVLSAFILYFIFIPPLISSDKTTYNNTYIQQPQKMPMNDYARSLESDIGKQLKSLEIAKQYNTSLDYNMKQNVERKLNELSKYDSNKYKGYKERYDNL